jgi:hypothetical protein
MLSTAKRRVILLATAAFISGTALTAQGAGRRLAFGPYALSIDGRSAGEYAGGYLPESGQAAQSLFEFTQSFALPPELAGERLSLLIGPHSYPFEIIINGRLAYSRGDPSGNGINPVGYDASTAPLAQDAFRPGGSNEIKVRAWVTTQKNPLFSVEILPYRSAEGAYYWRRMANTGITQAAFVVGIVISIYYFFLFLLLKGKSMYHLWFAVFSLGYSICYSNMAFNFPSNSFLVLEKVSRSGFALIVIVLVFFFTDYLGIQKKGRIGRIVKILDSVAALVCIAAFWSRKTNTDVDGVFNPVMTYYIFPNLLFCLGLLVTGAAKEKFKKHKVLLFAFACIFATAAHDIAFVSAGKAPYAFLLSLGFLAFILAVFFVMAAEQAKLEADTRATSIVIEKRGKAMALIMEKVKSASGNIVSCTERLREIAKSSIEGVAAYEEDSRGIQELVGSRLGDLERTVSELNASLGKSGELLREAIESQARLVGSIARSVEAMNSRVESIRGRTASSGELANHLAGIARESSSVIDRARKSIDRIRESSGFIRAVLDSINDISEQTSILSINAAIEAARAGESGKGFTIVASSIRGLASKTKETVDSSLVQLNGMNGLLTETDRLSNAVSDVLATIVKESDETALKVNEASAEVDSQEGEFGAIMESTRRMALGQSTIKSLSDKDATEKREHMNTLQAVRGEFTDIAEKLKRQRDEGRGLRASISELEVVVSESVTTIALLQSALGEEG